MVSRINYIRKRKFLLDLNIIIMYKNEWSNESNNWFFSIKFLKDITNMNIKKDCLMHKTSNEEYLYLFK